MHDQTPATRRELRDRDAEPDTAPGADVTEPESGPAVTGPEPGPSAQDAEPAAHATEPESGPAVTEPEPSPSARDAEPAATEPAPANPAPAAERMLIGGPIALTWIDPAATTAPRPAPEFALTGPATRPPDLLAGRRRRALRPGTVVPPLLILLLVAVYAAVTLLWPLNAVPPRVLPLVVQPLAAPAAAPAWPAQGEAAVAVQGMPDVLSSANAPESIASITKVVTALLVLERLPLAPGEQGPTYAFTQADSADYWQYRARGESSLDVPVDGTLTELQMLQGMLIASANNYAQRLASDLWPSNDDFVAAAANYLAERGITGITIVNPTGIEAGNTATPAALIALAEKALQNPVIAEIVRTPELSLPGAGSFRNGNPLLADPGVVGIKTGTLDAWNLLSAKDLIVGTTTVRVYAAVLGQPGPDSRDQASRDLYARLADEIQVRTSVPAGTAVGRVTTLWGQDVAMVTAEDASNVLWNGAAAQPATSFDLGDARDAGETVGTLVTTGPLDADTVDVRLETDIEPPSPWWRLTHPLDLLGLND
ncbi:D-alanyl-D-alanine carboxypeptidase [Microbacterium sp.]|uniref:D-alanyl-D-alanine carboxypeptidase family protein n=1 Tax=Microbacterium sp. TaxID=51671 RepID=UPI0025E64044|nr:D-alanyl-D-alanine carboxypeptidase [Microbacterium sp.]MBT9605226.1 D-alanyl-D-alanine carboxypeptidase [Microbacterium sp.]